MTLRVAINGFGRIGKTFLRAVLQDKNNLEIGAINLGPTKNPEQTALLFAYDSLMGTFPGVVEYKNQTLIINGKTITLLYEADATKLPWKALAIDWVIESSGKYTTKAKASAHLVAGCAKVLITAPAEDDDITIIPGINDHAYNAQKHAIVSLGSCTTNALAPLIKVITENFTLESAVVTTVHAYTNDQNLLDGAHNDPRRARAAALNIIPTKTGADKVITKLYPELIGKIAAIALRVPVPAVSIIDMSFTTEQNLTKEMVNSAFKKAAESNLKNILCYTTLPLVSSDFKGHPASAIFDAELTLVTQKTAKIFAWYDNEFAYSLRLKEFLIAIDKTK